MTTARNRTKPLVNRRLGFKAAPKSNGWMQEGRKWHFWRNWAFDGKSKYKFIRTFCTIFKILSPFIFQNIKQNVFKNATYDPIALIFDKYVKCKRVASATYKNKDKLETHFRYYPKYYILTCVLKWKLTFVLTTLLPSDIFTTVNARQS